jgi:hypothetical protein
MTCNLCLQRPYLFPLEQNIFLFDEDEMRAFFPGRVVEWMVAHAHPSNRHLLPEGSRLHFLPAGKGLPVLVATRISLSFPVLFSAVPLYTVKPEYHRRFEQGSRAPLGRDDLQVNWFSDGGIVSNFPIHLFDEWLPERPTFGISLSDLPPEAFQRQAPAGGAPSAGAARPAVGGPPAEVISEAYRSPGAEPPPPAPPEAAPARAEAAEEYLAHGGADPDTLGAVYLPRANAVQALDWRPLDGLTGLLTAIFYTAKNYRDTMQSLLPSYRERIVTIRFASHEGGMNLTMKPETIAKITAKGALAGRRLRDDFDFAHHRWVRLQVVLAQLEAELESVMAVYGRDPDYGRWLHDFAARAGFPYRRTEQWGEAAWRRVQALRDFLEASWAPAPRLNDDRVPRPALVKRFTPKE